MILLRYNEGFWGTIGLAAVLGGTIGNLADRIFNDGKVVDMFQTIPIRFPIFNIADIFITMGFLTFLVHFILVTLKAEQAEKALQNIENEGYDEYGEQDYDEQDSGEFAEIDAAIATEAEHELAFAERPSNQQDYEDTEQIRYETQMDSSQEYSPYPQEEVQESNFHDSAIDTAPETLPSLDEIDMELSSLGDYDVNDILREYGFEDD